MSIHRSPIAAGVLLALLLPAFGAAAADISKVNGSIQTEAGVHYNDLETVNGSIKLAANALADEIETVNGSVTLDSGAQADSIETVNGAITLHESAQVQDDVETVNGAIRLAAGSRIGGDAETVNGTITARQAVIGGDIETVNGSIELLEGSRVEGGILVRKPKSSWSLGKSGKPRVVIGAGSEVRGELVFEREVDLRVDPSARIGAVRGATVQTLEVEAR